MSSTGTMRALAAPIHLIDETQKAIEKATTPQEVRKLLLSLAWANYNQGVVRGGQTVCIQCGYVPPANLPRKPAT